MLLRMSLPICLLLTGAFIGSPLHGQDLSYEDLETLLDIIIDDESDDETGDPLEFHCCNFFHFTKSPSATCFSDGPDACTHEGNIHGIKVFACADKDGKPIESSEEIVVLDNKCQKVDYEVTCVPKAATIFVTYKVGELKCPEKPDDNFVCLCEWKEKPLGRGEKPFRKEIKKCFGPPCPMFIADVDGDDYPVVLASAN